MVRAVLLAVLAVIVAFTIWLLLPLWTEPETIVLSESAAVRRLLEQGPPAAGTIVAIPSFAPALRRYEDIVAPLLGSESDRTALFAAKWLLGSEPVSAWDAGDSWGAMVPAGSIRSLLIRTAGPLAGLQVEPWRGSLLLNGGPPPRESELPAFLAQGLEGEIFLRHLEGSDGYPPTALPALSSLRYAGGRLVIDTRAPATESVETLSLDGLTFPADALLAIRFAQPPAAVLAIDKAFPVDLPRYLAAGGMVALYGIETDGLVPRPRVVFAIPADEARAAEIESRIDRLTTRGAVGLILGMGEVRERLVAGIPVTSREGFGLTVETARRGGEVLIAFDGSSMDSYLGDRIVPAGEGEVAWALRASPQRLLPLLDELGEDRALQLFAADFTRETRRLASILRRLPPSRELRSRLAPSGAMMLLRTEADLAK